MRKNRTRKRETDLQTKKTKTMKNLFKVSMAAILALGMWSCMKEQPVEGGATALQFTIKQPVAPFVTRADIATTNEWNIAAMDVYAVEDGTANNVAKLVESTDYTVAQDAATHTFTITMMDAWLQNNGGKTMNFPTNYIVPADFQNILGPEIQKYIDKMITREELAAAFTAYYQS